MGSMSWTQLLFGFKGRIQRLYWWITSLVVSVVAGMLTQSLEFWAREMGAGAMTETECSSRRARLASAWA
jgi:uncharacterized membrane protein YhaH (DUF805 family)